MNAKLPLRFMTLVPLAMILGGCGPLTPRPDYWLTSKKSAWGTVEREAPYVLLRDYRTHVDWNGLSQTWFPKMEDLGVLPKGTVIRFTGFNVSRNVCGAQAFVYAEVLDGPNKGRTFNGIGLVETSVSRRKRNAWIVRIKADAVEPLDDP